MTRPDRPLATTCVHVERSHGQLKRHKIGSKHGSKLSLPAVRKSSVPFCAPSLAGSRKTRAKSLRNKASFDPLREIGCAPTLPSQQKRQRSSPAPGWLLSESTRRRGIGRKKKGNVAGIYQSPFDKRPLRSLPARQRGAERRPQPLDVGFSCSGPVQRGAARLLRAQYVASSRRLPASPGLLRRKITSYLSITSPPADGSREAWGRSDPFQSPRTAGSAL